MNRLATTSFLFGLILPIWWIRQVSRIFHLRAKLLLNPRDLWVGAYWTDLDVIDVDKSSSWYENRHRERHVYVCLVPAVPLHIWWRIGERNAPSQEVDTVYTKRSRERLLDWGTIDTRRA